MNTLREVCRVSRIPVVLASLCCLSPIILVLLGVSTVSFASSLADTLYGDYKWVFRGIGLVALLGSLAYYLYRQKGICSIDQVRRRRNEIINYIALTVVAGVLGYMFFLYVVVHYLGVWLAIWK
ncbi:MAG: mercuric transporter MerT family protein [Candidatus Moranbacteria bacterium]|nr:mercuric transporter MerT family protein [Candidatus Moranbacteria bacterium]